MGQDAKEKHSTNSYFFHICLTDLLKIKTQILMAINEDFLNYILGQLAKFGEVEVKKMFGGAGLKPYEAAVKTKK